MATNFEYIRLSLPKDTFAAAWPKVNSNFALLEQQTNQIRSLVKLNPKMVYDITYASYVISGTADIDSIHNYFVTGTSNYVSYQTIQEYITLFGVEPVFTGFGTFGVKDVKAVAAVDRLYALSGTFNNSDIQTAIDTLDYPEVTSGTLVIGNPVLNTLKEVLAPLVSQ